MRIDDNGCGMDAETLERAVNPFFTTRTTRKGAGLPFFSRTRSSAAAAPGCVPGRDGARWSKHAFRSTTSTVRLRATWPGTLMQLIVGNPGVNIRIRLDCGRRSARLATREIADALEGLRSAIPG